MGILCAIECTFVCPLYVYTLHANVPGHKLARINFYRCNLLINDPKLNSIPLLASNATMDFRAPISLHTATEYFSQTKFTCQTAWCRVLHIKCIECYYIHNFHHCPVEYHQEKLLLCVEPKDCSSIFVRKNSKYQQFSVDAHVWCSAV